MFGKKLAAAHAQLLLISTALAAVGFDIKALETDPKALEAFLADDSTAPVLADLEAKLAAKSQEAQVYSAGLAAAGVKIDGALSTEAVTASVAALIKSKADAAAIATVVATGHDPLPVAAEGASGGDASAKDLHAQYNAITDSVKRADFYAKHKDKLLK